MLCSAAYQLRTHSFAETQLDGSLFAFTKTHLGAPDVS